MNAEERGEQKEENNNESIQKIYYDCDSGWLSERSGYCGYRDIMILKLCTEWVLMNGSRWVVGALDV